MSRSDGPLAGARFVVAGGSGHIGAETCRSLVGMGASVVAIHRSPVTHLTTGVESVRMDLLQTPELGRLLMPGDTVIHLAALVGGIQMQQRSQADLFFANQRITESVLSASAFAGVSRVLIASSAVVYAIGESDAGDVTVDAPLIRPGADVITGYAWSKVDDEVAAHLFHQAGEFDVVIGRLTNVYGEHGSFDPARSTVVHELIRRAFESRPLGYLEVWGDGSAVRSFLHEEDAGAAVAMVAAHGRSGAAYNLDSGESISIKDLATTIRDAVDPELELRFRPDQPTGVARRVLNTDGLRDLGFRPSVGIVDGVKRTVAGYRQRFRTESTDVETGSGHSHRG